MCTERFTVESSPDSIVSTSILTRSFEYPSPRSGLPSAPRRLARCGLVLVRSIDFRTCRAESEPNDRGHSRTRRGIATRLGQSIHRRFSNRVTAALLARPLLLLLPRRIVVMWRRDAGPEGRGDRAPRNMEWTDNIRPKFVLSCAYFTAGKNLGVFNQKLVFL